MLLGENGAGKSATLRAIGLALASTSLPDLEAAAGIDWARLLRRGPKQGRVLLEFTDGRASICASTAPGLVLGGAPRMEGFVRGFGATRLLGDRRRVAGRRTSGSATCSTRASRSSTPRRGCSGIRSEGDFNVAAVAIAELLGRHDEVDRDRRARPVHAQFIQA